MLFYLINRRLLLRYDAIKPSFLPAQVMWFELNRANLKCAHLSELIVFLPSSQSRTLYGSTLRDLRDDQRFNESD